jgi:hypothetical protein
LLYFLEEGEKTMKKSNWKNFSIGSIILGMIVIIMIGCGSDDSTTTTNKVVSGVAKTKSYLFVQSGTSGSFVDDGSGNYTLTIQGVSPQTIYFSDRPERDVGQISMQKFLTRGCFNSDNPPNAAITLMNADEKNDVIVVELLHPVYDATTATLQYTAHILKDTNLSVSSINERRDDSIPDTFDAVALFIDDCPDLTITCGDENGNEAGKTVCCTCWDWGCDFQSDCCSFERCQNNCTTKFGLENKYIKVYCPTNNEVHWVDNVKDWEYWNESCPRVAPI